MALWRDLRFAFRLLWRNPGFTWVSLFTLTLGIAATSAVGSVANAVLFKSLPYPDPGRLVAVEQSKNEKGELLAYQISWLDFKDFQARSDVFQDLGAYSSPTSFTLLVGGEAQRVQGELATASYFRLLELRPAAGRLFLPQDDATPGVPRHVLLGHGLWRRRFGGDPGVVGQTLVVDGRGYQIVGVLPEGFQGLTDEAEIWLPITLASEVLGDPRFLERRGVRWLQVAGRLKPGRSVEQADQALDAVNAALRQEYPDSNENMVVEVKTLSEAWFGDLRFALLTLLGAALFVLLIAWATVANLLLARATARQREVAVRSSLGASWGQLTRQLLAESLLLGLLSALGGLLLAAWTTDLLVDASAVRFRSFVDIGLEPRVIGAVVALSLACAAAFGLAPAWMSVRQGVSSLRDARSSSGTGRRRLQSSLVVAEVALAFFLLAGAGLVTKSFQRYLARDLGFQPKDLLTVRVDLKGERYADPGIMILLARQYLERLRTLPGVASAVIESPGMPTDGSTVNSFVIEDLLSTTKDGVVPMAFHHVTPGYFAALGIPLVRGRDFTAADTPDSPLAIIISQQMARRVWPDEDPLGKRMRFGKRDPNAPWFTVVGVVGDLRQEALRQDPWTGPEAYFSILQFPPLLVPRLSFLIRPEGVPAESLASQVEAELRAVAPEVPPYDFDTMQRRLERFEARERFLMLLMTLFAAVALVLATAGLYGVLSYSVIQRARELGIRMALGAQSRDLLRLVIGRAAVLAAAGLLLGLAASLGLNRLFASLLYGVSPTDLAILSGVGALLFAVALAAASVPARRALRTDPTISFRAEG